MKAVWKEIVAKDISKRFKQHQSGSRKTTNIPRTNYGNNTRKSLIYELTVPSKENILLTYARKLGKYLNLCENCINNG